MEDNTTVSCESKTGARHTDFIEKNRDKLPREATELLVSPTNNFVKDLAPSISNPDGDITAKVSGGGASTSKPKEREKKRQAWWC